MNLVDVGDVMSNTKTNIFAIEYLELMTECQDKLKEFRKQKTFNLFGREVLFTDKKVSEIIQHSVDEYENTIEFETSIEDINVSFYFSVYEDCLYNSEILLKSDNPDDFFLKYFNYTLEDLSKEQIEKVFNTLNSDQLLYFSAMYYTATEAFIIDSYKSKYTALKDKYPNLSFYPSFDFNYNLTDYYESSRC